MTTDVDIDPRMVCVACGWDVAGDGLISEVPVSLDYLRAAPDQFVSEVLDALAGDVSLRRDGDHWIAMRSGHLPGVTARASTPHEAVFALATQIGRVMEVDA